MDEQTNISTTNEVKEITREEVIDVLKTCYDPEIPIDIWELGLIYELTVVMNNIHVRMTLTTPHCPAAQSLPSEVEQRLKSISGVKDVTVEIVWDPPYNTSMMSEEAKLTLGFA